MQKNRTHRNLRNVSLMYLLILICLISICVFPVEVHANVPVILDMSTVEAAGKVSLEIQINHLNPSIGQKYSADHYVNLVEVEIDGTPHQISVMQPPTAETFKVTYYIGQLTGYPTIRVRAHCTIHGWSEWSQPQVIPEYSNGPITVTVIAILFILIMKRISLSSRSLREGKSKSLIDSIGSQWKRSFL